MQNRFLRRTTADRAQDIQPKVAHDEASNEQEISQVPESNIKIGDLEHNVRSSTMEHNGRKTTRRVFRDSGDREAYQGLSAGSYNESRMVAHNNFEWNQDPDSYELQDNSFLITSSKPLALEVDNTQEPSPNDERQLIRYTGRGTSSGQIIPRRLVTMTEENIELTFRIIGVPTFQKLIEYLKTTTKEGNIVATADGLGYSQLDGTQKLLNMFSIHRNDLPEYKYHYQGEYMIMGIDFSLLAKSIKSANKKGSLDIIKYAGTNELITQPGGEGGSRGRGRVSLQEIEYMRYDIDDFQRADDYPNCTISNCDFKKSCDAIIKVNPSSMYIDVYDLGIEFNADGDGNLLGQSYPFGNIEDHVGRINVRTDLFKRISKICSISPADGVLKFYYDENIGLKITGYIGSYGHFTVAVRDSNAPPLFQK